MTENQKSSPTPHRGRFAAMWTDMLNRAHNLPDPIKLVMIATLIGLLAGMAAVALKALVGLLEHYFFKHLNAESANFRLLIYPLAGILLTSIYQRYITRQDCSGGTAIMKRKLMAGDYHYHTNTIFNSIIGCAMTIGFGASAGTEGPVAYSGAAIGGKLSQWLKISPEWTRLLIGIGAGAGIAGIFKAPLGGALFTLEVIQMPMTTISVIALVLACLMATGAAEAFSAFSIDLPISKLPTFEPSTLGWVVLLALICGFYSVYYSYTQRITKKFFMSIENPWAKNIISGVGLSLPLFLLPALFGEGTSMIATILNERPLNLLAYGPFAYMDGTWVAMMIAAEGILIVKGAMVAAANNGGGVAGTFMPTLFAGCLLGYVFATCVNHWAGADLQVWYFALVGMGAVMAGTLEAPLMGLFIAAETTGSFRYIPAYIIAVLIAYFVVILCKRNFRLTKVSDQAVEG